MPTCNQMMARLAGAYERRMKTLPPEAAAEPCGDPPGSAEKILILGLRYRLGVPLWHSDDNLQAAGRRNGACRQNKV